MLDDDRKKAANAELLRLLAQLERNAERVLHRTGELSDAARTVLRATWSQGLTPQQRVPRLGEATYATVKLEELANTLAVLASNLSADVVEASRLNADVAAEFTT
jgi:hypothetical protein